MNKQKTILFVATLLLMGSGIGVLAHMKAIQKLGSPGVKTQPLSENKNLEVILPESVLDYSSEKRDQDPLVIEKLPKDTSFGQRLYRAPDGFQAQISVVLMGADRTSIHKPEFCLEGQGWKIKETTIETIHIEQPVPYELPVMKMTVSKQVKSDGKIVEATGFYVFWFVTDGAYTAQQGQRMWSTAKHLLKTGTLERWAYVSYFTAGFFDPNHEKERFDRLKKLIAASVPEFQLAPKPEKEVAASNP